MLKHYCTYYFPGLICSESGTEEVKERTPDIEYLKKHKECYGFYFYDVEERKVDGEMMKGNHKNVSPTYYINGKIFTTEQLKRFRHNPNDNLVWNCEHNGGKVVRCGQNYPSWMLCHEGDIMFPLGDKRTDDKV